MHFCKLIPKGEKDTVKLLFFQFRYLKTMERKQYQKLSLPGNLRACPPIAEH